MSDIEPHLTLRLAGGLGNQLFQFFAGYAQSLRLNCQLGLVKPEKNNTDTLRNFELESLTALPNVFAARTLPANSTFQEKTFRFDKRINRVKVGTQLQGYFQSPKYFEAWVPNPIDLLLGDEDFRSGTSAVIENPFLAIHYRRGDYLEPANQSFHGLLPDDYFIRSIAELRERLGSLPVVVFSDDPQRAQTLSQKIPLSEVFSHTKDSARLALGALSQARGWVLSNSSFSWWGAYLSGNKDQTVIAPKEWFRSGTHSPVDLLPRQWLQR